MSKFTKALEKIQIEKEEKRESQFPEVKESGPARWDRGIPKITNTKPDTRIVAYHFPNSMIAEQYRILRTNLKEQLGKEGGKVILVSSAIHGEGKTVSVTNLALCLAEMGDCKVALLDADLRRGKIGEYLGLDKNLPGLSNYLTNGLTTKQIMVRNSIENLYIIPRGDVPKNPSEIVTSSKFKVLLSELRVHFDYVLIDAPPIMSVADASIFGREADGVLMVIQSGRTPKTVIAHAHLLFKQAGVKMLGYILTNVEYQSSEYRYYYHYYTQDGESPPTDFKTQLVQQVRFLLEKFRMYLEKKEEDFNTWWEKKCLKSEKKKKRKV
ncbi:MAG: CpsD/CapB family tyrosine-protein kinase [Candidatus Omnitrophica bacterium]|nr:CpsD/CapB family tyrosine-protein kinase [Candidatus Omnitrophota bacterium]